MLNLKNLKNVVPALQVHLDPRANLMFSFNSLAAAPIMALMKVQSRGMVLLSVRCVQAKFHSCTCANKI